MGRSSCYVLFGIPKGAVFFVCIPKRCSWTIDDEKEGAGTSLLLI